MKTIYVVSELEKLLQNYREQQKKIIFVPTMGALHLGHLSLIEKGQTVNNAMIIVSIFVNRLQFNDVNDYNQYPTKTEKDIALAKQSDVDILWLPKEADLFSNKSVLSQCQFLLDSGSLGKALEGKSRPKHFDGVVTVVDRMLNIVRPTHVVLGEKDYQQKVIIETFFKKRSITFLSGETVRDPKTGLALSSRNSQLSLYGIDAARLIYMALLQAKEYTEIHIENFYPTAYFQKLKKIVRDVLETNKLIKIDYIEIRARKNLAERIGTSIIILVAVSIEGVRLIDNIKIDLQQK